MPYVNKADAHAINRKYEELKNDYYKAISEYDDEPDISFFEGTAFSSEYLFNDLDDLADKIKNRLESIHYETDNPKYEYLERAMTYLVFAMDRSAKKVRRLVKGNW